MFTPAFRGFHAGRLVSLLGSAMTPVALALAVLDASGEPGDLGIVLAAQLVPNLALLLVGGAVADRWPRRAVLVAANLGAGLTQGVVAAVLLTGHYSLPLLAGIELANGALQAFTMPALRGILPELVGPAELQRANAALAAAANAAKIFGPTAAGLLSATVGGGWAIALDALSFLGAATLLARLRIAAKPAVVARQGLRADLRDGWRVFRGIRWVWVTTLAFFVINLVNTGPWQILGPLLTTQRSGQASWGLVLSARAVGLLVMSVVLSRMALRNPLRAGQCAGALGGLGLVGLGLGLPAPWVMACAFLAGLGFTTLGVTWDTAVQHHVPNDALSRVCAYSDLLSYAAIPAGQLMVGPAADHWGGAAVALCCGLAFAVAALAPLAVRDVRELRAPEVAGVPRSRSA
ncbi:MFS transporter [Labedaea rhizosphaerae]|uniref:Putative MFS family arabinose efflux permease n=1 Tax=Labedaea rhizosphaerae TaxID=598644 RepID=A0A4R6SQ02_LABRH|nr:MFS transporter [Labedaea rhizosphaerae]TDQ05680.1 putative MFS family arabinose efflux permease [Labedaea rhizosphaerae]